MADNFTAGEADADTGAPPIETMGARYGVTEAMPGRGAHEPQVEPYLMPSVAGRNGSMERVADSIGLTPLGGMMPGPFAIPPAIVVGSGAWPVPEDGNEFHAGIADGYYDGCPIPFK